MRSLLSLSFLIFTSLLLFYCPPVWAEAPIHTFTNIGTVEKEQIINNMIAVGYTETMASKVINILQLDGKTAFQQGESIYVGDRQNIIAGNYYVCGITHFSEQNESYLNMINYKDKLPVFAVLSDGHIFEFKNGSAYHFTITIRSDDGQREYVAEYKTKPNKAPEVLKGALGIRPEIQRSVLRLKEFGAELYYDSEGNLMDQSLQILRKGSKDFSFSIIPGKDKKTMKTGIGFVLKSKKTGKEEMYSFLGRRILVNTEDKYLGIGDQREVVESDVKQEVTVIFSKYGDINGTVVSFYRIFKQHVEVLSTEGKITKFLTKTQELCDNPDKFSF